MLDSLGVDSGRLFVDTNGEQEPKDRFVPCSRLGSEFQPLARQCDRSVGFRFEQSFFLKSRDDSGNRHMADGEAFGEVDHAAATLLSYDVGHRLDVVLGRLGRMIPPRTTMGFGR